MAFAEKEDPAMVERKRKGKLLGIGGLALLFGSGLSIRLVSEEWTIAVLGLMAVAVVIIVVSYFMVR